MDDERPRVCGPFVVPIRGNDQGFHFVMPDGAEIFVLESAAFGADGRRLYVTFPVTVNGKDAGDRTYAIAMDRPTPPEAVVDHAGYPLPSPDGRSLAYPFTRRRLDAHPQAVGVPARPAPTERRGLGLASRRVTRLARGLKGTAQEQPRPHADHPQLARHQPRTV
jgi:hypothetical protein